MKKKSDNVSRCCLCWRWWWLSLWCGRRLAVPLVDALRWGHSGDISCAYWKWLFCVRDILHFRDDGEAWLMTVLLLTCYSNWRAAVCARGNILAKMATLCVLLPSPTGCFWAAQRLCFYHRARHLLPGRLRGPAPVYGVYSFTITFLSTLLPVVSFAWATALW